MTTRVAGVVMLVAALSGGAGRGRAQSVDREALFAGVAAAMPDYREFMTVDELQRATVALRDRYPDTVTLREIGRTAAGSPITECVIGRGSRHALLFGFPHPNEPIGSLMLHYLAGALAQNEALRRYFDVTWHLVLCADPDKARLNEGWFKGPFDLTTYSRHFYRPPSYQQVEWTFPVTYKKHAFTTPTPEARALMSIIDATPLAFSFGLHNADFGGVYYYWSEDVPRLYPVLYRHIARLGLPLHLGEPEAPWGRKFDARSMFRMLYFTDEYDYMERYSPTPPEQLLKSGASSDDYVREKHPKALTVNCELPYYYDARIEDTTPSGMTRLDSTSRSLAEERQLVAMLARWFAVVKPKLSSGSLFVDATEEYLRTAGDRMAAEEKLARTSPDYARQATVAEAWDAASLRKARRLRPLGQFVRMLEDEKARTGTRCSEEVQQVLGESLAAFNARAAEAERELRYTVIPIKKLASLQLLTALYAMDEVQRR